MRKGMREMVYKSGEGVSESIFLLRFSALANPLKEKYSVNKKIRVGLLENLNGWLVPVCSLWQSRYWGEIYGLVQIQVFCGHPTKGKIFR
jgi:hypothetical protein